MSHSICIIHVATSRFPIQRLLAWHISTCISYSSRGCRGLPRHTIMCNSLGSTWKLRSDSGEHWKGAPRSWEHWKGASPFVSRQCFPNTRFFNPSKPSNKNLTSINKSKRRNIILPRRKKTVAVDTVIQEITDEDGIIEDIAIESASTVESVLSGDSGATVVTMETLGHKTNIHHMDGNYARVYLYHNSLPYDVFNLMMSEEFRSGILQ